MIEAWPLSVRNDSAGKSKDYMYLFGETKGK
jgi:hypothetical protein